MAPTVLWDFDGTLAQRPGMWSRAVVEVLDEASPGHGIAPDDVRPALRDGFPWHRPDRPHPELNDPAAWWGAAEELFAHAYRSVGWDGADAAELAGRVRERYLDAARWRVFDDTLPALERLRERGWAHVIVSNHVPELARLVDDLGLGNLVDHVVTSARVGFEKPHPGIFERALAVAGVPAPVWMVGDNPVADVAGAEAVGIPAVLVRRDAEVPRRVDDLWGVAAVLDAST